MNRRRNPDTPTPKKKSSGGLKNWLILGGVGVAGYLGYKYVTKNAGSIESKVASATGKKIPGPDLNGPLVSKFEIASTKTTICISAPVAGFAYAPITSINPQTGYNTFSATVAGHFTRRLLCKGNQRWAEIKPTSALGSLGEFIDVGFGKRVIYRAP